MNVETLKTPGTQCGLVSRVSSLRDVSFHGKPSVVPQRWLIPLSIHVSTNDGKVKRILF